MRTIEGVGCEAYQAFAQSDCITFGCVVKSCIGDGFGCAPLRFVIVCTCVRPYILLVAG